MSFGNFFLGGTGVPPGTKPETCRRCKGKGMVSIFTAIFFFFTLLFYFSGITYRDVSVIADVHGKRPICHSDDLYKLWWNRKNIYGIVCFLYYCLRYSNSKRIYFSSHKASSYMDILFPSCDSSFDQLTLQSVSFL